MVVQVRAIPVGTPAAAMTCLAKDFDPSSWAASLEGPNTAIPSARSASDTPATSGASGPMIASLAPCSSANFTTSVGEFGFRFGWQATSLAIPAFPGATVISAAGVPVLISDLIMACSLAP
ncbi:unannotated protein [freshwater metagenome]|uniref:Unannotated protein n=1 Tax=freshwater metagenome TaxID=449393 RepID=A0A6J6CZX1_9ZZZZ